MYKKIKRRTFEIIQQANDNDISSKVFDIFLITLIIINLFVAITETFMLSDKVQKFIGYIENTSTIIFTIEYILRIWTADFLHKDKHPFKARVRYIFSFMAIIDLLSVLPFYVPLMIPVDLRILKTLRIIRMFRLFKINRYTDAFSTIGKVFKAKASQLISSMFVVGLVMVISAVIMYNVESAAQPEQFQNVFSGLWWAMATLTTVGYGDIYPVTAIGKILSIFIAMLGIGLVAVPTGIITSGFMEIISENQQNNEQDKKSYCPYCGHKIDN